MAIEPVLSKRALKLHLSDGFNGDKEVIKTKSFSNIRTAATNEQLYSTGVALAGLVEQGLLKVYAVQEEDLIEI